MMEQTAQKIALLVIDVQKGLFEKSTRIYRAEQLLENINDLMSRARQAGAPVIFIQHSNPTVLEEGSVGWHLHPRIQPLADEPIVHKTHGNAFEDTNLSEELTKRDISNLVITGLVTHGCVKATCLGALEEGYQVILVSDAHSSYSKDAANMIEKWNHELHEKGAIVKQTREITFSGK